jgi:hypothetical protein
MSEVPKVCLDKAIAEVFNEVQVYSNIVVLVKEGLVKIERYITVELENLGEGWFRASVMNANRWVKDYCVKRFTVHPFNVPVPLFTVNKIVRE